MPLYEYQCQECGEIHEVLQRVSDPPYTICSGCGGALKKLVSAPAIQFKGSGFYITDYGKGNAAARSESKSESKGEGGGGESSKAAGSETSSSGSGSSTPKP